jgi:hypothetical protein
MQAAPVHVYPLAQSVALAHVERHFVWPSHAYALQLTGIPGAHLPVPSHALLVCSPPAQVVPQEMVGPG